MPTPAGVETEAVIARGCVEQNIARQDSLLTHGFERMKRA
jgi:hypothetical protein